MPTPRKLPPQDEVESFTAWPLVAAIGLAKLATFGVVIAVSLDRESLALIGATSGPWLAVGFALLATPIVFHVRLRRARRRRVALICAEWRLEPSGDEHAGDLPEICRVPASHHR